jgi:class 3 adenylate cyclase
MTLAPDLPRHRAIVALDVEGSTARTNPTKAKLRQAMYELLEEAFRSSGITDEHRDPFVDCGDGILALIRPVDQAPKPLLLNQVVPVLSELLIDYGARFPELRFRLRVVVHAGEVHFDRRGCFGEAIDVSFRLLEAPTLKARLQQSDDSLVLVVSDDIYRSVVRHGYHGIDARTYEQSVQVDVGGRTYAGWVYVPSRSTIT